MSESVGTEDRPAPHDDAACGTCTFVSDRAFIHVAPELLETAAMTPGKMLKCAAGLTAREDFIVELGLFTLPGWPGHAMWYLFECPECTAPVRDYLHGYRLYLKCPECDARWGVSQKRFYETSGMQPPPSGWAELRELWRRRREYRRTDAEDGS